MTGRIEKLRTKFPVEVRWVAFPLHPETPADGLLLTDLFAGRNLDIDQMTARLKQAAAEAGLPFGDRRRTYNSRLAQELGKWAEVEGRGEAYHRAVFQAYFAEGLNIGKAAILLELAQRLGLPVREAATVLESRKFRESVDRDWTRSHELGVTAVPTFLRAGRFLVGAQPYPVLERFIRSTAAR